jgi:hypothetical protein
MIPVATPKMMYHVVLDTPLPADQKIKSLDKRVVAGSLTTSQLFYCEICHKQMNESKLEKYIPSSTKAGAVR